MSTVPERLGTFVIERELGSGAFGVVYLAYDESLDRNVALKVLRQDCLSSVTTGRFRAEVEALRQLADDTHNHFPRLHQTGTFDGVPFASMDYVAGGPIDSFCDERRLRLEQRLRLFADACRAVGTAHQAGIIHRDLKPQHVLIHEDQHGNRPLGPRIIDWGMARGLDLVLDIDVNTRGAMIGTPGYISPEQAIGQRVGVQTDVYSLGVVLYKLLTGCMPQEQDAASEESFARHVHDPLEPIDRRWSQLCAHDPERSAQLAELRATHSDELQRQLRGDLALIVQTATAPDRTRRYADVTALVADIESLLAMRPIEARETSRWYRCRLWLRRKRPLVVAGCSVALAAAFSGYALWQNVAHAQDLAKIETQKLQSDNAALTAQNEALATDLFAAAEAAAQRGRWLKALDSYQQAEAAGFADELALGVRRVQAFEASYQASLAKELADQLLARADVMPQRARLLLLRSDLGQLRFEQPGAGLADAKEALRLHQDGSSMLLPVEFQYAQALLAKTPREALAHLTKARVADASDHRVNQSYAMTLILLGEREAAIRFAGTFLAQNPDDEEAHYLSLMMLALNEDQSAAEMVIDAIAAKFGNEAEELAQSYVAVVNLIPWMEGFLRDTFMAHEPDWKKLSGGLMKVMWQVTPLLNKLRDRREDRQLEGLEDTMMRVPPALARQLQPLMELQSSQPFRVQALTKAFSSASAQQADACLVFFDAMSLLYMRKGQQALERLQEALAGNSVLISRQLRLHFAVYAGGIVFFDESFGLTDKQRDTAQTTVRGWLQEMASVPLRRNELRIACMIALHADCEDLYTELLLRFYRADKQHTDGRLARIEALSLLGARERARELFRAIQREPDGLSGASRSPEKLQGLWRWLNR